MKYIDIRPRIHQPFFEDCFSLKVLGNHFCTILIKPFLKEYKDILSTKTPFILQNHTFCPIWQLLEPQKRN